MHKLSNTMNVMLTYNIVLVSPIQNSGELMVPGEPESKILSISFYHFQNGVPPTAELAQLES